MITRFLLSTALAGTASLAMAQDSTYYNGTLGYSEFSEGGDSLSSSFLGFEGGTTFGDFMVSSTLDVMRLDTSGGGSGPTLTGTSINGAYAITPSISVGASYTHLDFDGSTENTSEIFATFDGTQMSGPFFGRIGIGEGEVFFGDRYIGVTGGYEFAQGTEAALSLYRSLDNGSDETLYVMQVQHSGQMFDVDGRYFGVSDDDFNQLDIDFAYAVTPQIDILADFSSFDSGDVKVFGLGGSYEFMDGISAYAKVNRLSAPSESIDGFGFGVTFEMGEGSLKDQNSYERVIRPLYFNGDFPFLL